jgi:hypothetical protein
MKRWSLIAVLVLFWGSTAFAVDTSTKTFPSTITPGSAVLLVNCCISGHYEGSKEDTLCKPGETPHKGKFTMDITQATRCGGTFTAKVTDSEDGKITDFSGTVTASTIHGCCTIIGNSTSGTDNVKFKGTICKEATKWRAKGSFTSVNCSGVWNMQQP